MSEGAAMNLETAKMHAGQFIMQILDVCDKVEIAGSIRRGKQQVHDIEILAMPKFEVKQEMLLDGVVERKVNLLHQRMQQLLRNGTVTADRQRKDRHKDPFGERYYRVNFNPGNLKIPIDLFVVLPPAQWGTQLVIRTGCAEFSHWIVSLRISHGLRFRDGHLERMGQVIDTPTEESVFEALRLPFVPPERRELDEHDLPMWPTGEVHG